jgi:hypothetical protein
MAETTNTPTPEAKPAAPAKVRDPRAPTKFSQAVARGEVQDDGDPEGGGRKPNAPDGGTAEKKSDEYLRNLLKRESDPNKAKREEKAREVAAETFIEDVVPDEVPDQDPDEKPQPKTAKGKTTADVAAEEDEGEPDKPDTQEDEDSDPELERARKEARRVLGKSADSILAKLDRAEVIALAKHQAKISREVNERLEEAKAIANGATKKDAPAGTEVKVTDPFDLDALVQPFVDVYGDEAKEPLQRTLAPIIQAHKQYQDTQRRMEAFGFELALEVVRGGLRAEFPQTKDDDEWARVVDQVETLVKTGKFTGQGMKGLPKLVRQAAAVVYAEEIQALAKRKAKQADEAERYGRVDTSEITAPGSKILTPEQRERAIGMAIVRGQRGEDARRRIERGR